MPSSQDLNPSFMPVSCAEIIFPTGNGEDWRGPATWIAIVGGNAPRLFANMVSSSDLPPTSVDSFSVHFPEDGDRPPTSVAAAHILCDAGSATLEHGRFLLCGAIAAVRPDEVVAPWLSQLLRASRSTAAHLSG